MGFPRFHFHVPLTIPTDFRKAMSAYDDEFYEKVYHGWIEDFYRRARLSAMSQLSAHCQEVFKEAMRYCGTTDPDTVREYYPYELQQIERDMGYDLHEQQVDKYHEYLNSLRPKTDTLIVTGFEMLDAFLQMLEGVDNPLPSPDFLYPIFDRIWFNQTMTPGLFESVSELRSLPYPEYLKSMHWKATRAAMMLLHNARCQSQKCGWGDGWWMGGEYDLNVHHLTYKNRGNERYEDLLLLCRDCHTKVHKVGIDAVMKDSDWDFRKTAGVI